MKNFCLTAEKVKNVINYVILLCIYIIIWILLTLYCLFNKLKSYIIKLHLICKYSIIQIIKCSNVNDINLNKLKNKSNINFQLLKNKICNIFYNCLFKKNEKHDNVFEIHKNISKVPKHIYIIFKINDLIILNRKKLINYIVNILIYLYEFKVEHVTIYVSDPFFNYLFFYDLFRYLYERNFYMKSVIKENTINNNNNNNNKNNSNFLSCSDKCNKNNHFYCNYNNHIFDTNKSFHCYDHTDEFIITKFYVTDDSPSQDIYSSELCYTKRKSKDKINTTNNNNKDNKKCYYKDNKKCTYRDNKKCYYENNHKGNDSATNYTYNKFSLHLKFLNKDESHKHLIRIVNEKGNMLSEGVLINDMLNFSYKNIESVIEKIYELDKTYNNKNTDNIKNIKNVHNIFFYVCYFFYELKNILLLKINCLYFRLSKNILLKGLSKDKLRIYSYNNISRNIYYIWNVLKSPFSFHSKYIEKEMNNKEKLKTNDKKNITINIIHKLFNNVITQDEKCIQNIKELINKNIPMYVKPIYQDIFNHNIHNIFHSTNVDIVISLRLSLYDYLIEIFHFFYQKNYDKKKKINKLKPFNFFWEYISSFLFLYKVVHPFEQNGIQPWVLSNSELYEFYGYHINSLKKSILYYNRSTQRCGH
ncbi:conserved Plasmodium protein, unknown function [Plasmodium sp. gorilla clade G2]|uniref:conserved Plasmodium protein, unknown function n=1 Tax=Plasmodium sp. gorilla clade G2 TaxID=880535 RepID=UPI000D224F7C|nr:conserved Plasmodium protein, unknown function [Plasmodium sp. gorilla clade G2]SOV13721.1 conserved Plasmodium protein, unknown function [Plasmodium sp. gorilla clade G2]